MQTCDALILCYSGAYSSHSFSMMKTPDQALQVSRPAIDNLASEAFDTREAIVINHV